MKIIFEQKKINNGTVKISLDGGTTYEKYEIADVLESGISLNEDQDLSLIKIKGSANILQSVDVVSSIKVDDVKGMKFILDTDYYGKYFPDCVVEIIIQDDVSLNYASDLNYYPYLRKVTGSILEVDKEAFKNNEYITDVILKDTHSIRDSAFSICSNLKNIVLPDSLSTIGVSAFSDCNSLTSIIIPKSVTKIGDYAFYGCTSLQNMYYIGTEEEWNAISRGMMCFQDCPGYTNMIFNYQG